LLADEFGLALRQFLQRVWQGVEPGDFVWRDAQLPRRMRRTLQLDEPPRHRHAGVMMRVAGHDHPGQFNGRLRRDDERLRVGRHVGFDEPALELLRGSLAFHRHRKSGDGFENWIFVSAILARHEAVFDGGLGGFAGGEGLLHQLAEFFAFACDDGLGQGM